MKYCTSELKVPAVVKQQMDYNVAAPAATILGDLIECLDVVPGVLQLLQGTFQPGSSHIRLGSGKPKLDTGIAGLAPTTEPN